MSRRFRDPEIEILVDWIESHPGEPPTDAVRELHGAILARVGSELLRELPRTRAYHARSGDLAPDELLQAGAVESLIRGRTGLASEPAQPVERPARRRGLADRIRGG